MIKAVIFDMDGVLIDSTKINIKVVNAMLKHFHKKKATKTQEHMINSKPKLASFAYFFHNNIIEGLLYFKSIEKQYYDKIHPSRHLHKLLRYLRAKQIKLGIVTNRDSSAWYILKHIRADNYFDTVITADDTRKHKPNGAPLLKAIKNLCVKKNEVLYVGDMDVDVLTARHAGVKCVLHSRNPNFKANYRIYDLANLKKIIEVINNESKRRKRT